MPFCTNCGSELELHFCLHCGTAHIETDLTVTRDAHELRNRFIAQYEELDQQDRAAFSDARFVLLEAIGSRGARNGSE
jgi:hypothetical protein